MTLRSSFSVLALALLVALVGASCGGSKTDAPATIACEQSLADYCAMHAGTCVMHLTPSSPGSSYCSQCTPTCSKQTFAFEACEDTTVAVVTQVGSANQSQGVELITYLYDGMTLNLVAVLDSTTGGSYQSSVRCLGGAQTVQSHGVCANQALPITCT